MVGARGVLHVHVTWGRGVSPRGPSSLLSCCQGTQGTQMTVNSRCLHGPACLYQADLLVERQLDVSRPLSTSSAALHITTRGEAEEARSPLTTFPPHLHWPEPKLCSQPWPSSAILPPAPSSHPSSAARTLPSLLATCLRLAPGLCPAAWDALQDSLLDHVTSHLPSLRPRLF